MWATKVHLMEQCFQNNLKFLSWLNLKNQAFNSFKNIGDVFKFLNLLLTGVDGTGNKLAPVLLIPVINSFFLNWIHKSRATVPWVQS